jgi:thiamine-phosphate diphosphorylase/hydroxyethylthiazole kinase
VTSEFPSPAPNEAVLLNRARYQVPLIINDRVDIALAVGAGVHLGQEDMPIDIARKLLPPDAIVGLSCNTIEHARKAVEARNVDYIGIGAIYDTKTKQNSPEKVIGPRQAANIVKALQGSKVKSVAIGGIKSSNALRVLSGAVSDDHLALDGVAVVSEIMAASDSRAAAEKLAAAVRSFKEAHSNFLTAQPATNDLQQLPSVLGRILGDVRQHRPVVHQVSTLTALNKRGITSIDH